jgi:Multiubiquitin
MPERVQPIEAEEILETVVDIEECSRIGRKPPRARHYRIRIDKKQYVVDTAHPTGRALLELAGKTPPEKWILRQIFRNGPAVPIGLDQKVDLTTPGVEKFSTMPKDISDGAR